MECCEYSTNVRIDVEEEMGPITCYYTKNGCPIYPMWDDDDDANLCELDNS
jgi:hypothetical protein